MNQPVVLVPILFIQCTSLILMLGHFRQCDCRGISGLLSSLMKSNNPKILVLYNNQEMERKHQPESLNVAKLLKKLKPEPSNLKNSLSNNKSGKARDDRIKKLTPNALHARRSQVQYNQRQQCAQNDECHDETCGDDEEDNVCAYSEEEKFDCGDAAEYELPEGCSKEACLVPQTTRRTSIKWN